MLAREVSLQTCIHARRHCQNITFQDILMDIDIANASSPPGTIIGTQNLRAAAFLWSPVVDGSIKDAFTEEADRVEIPCYWQIHASATTQTCFLRTYDFLPGFLQRHNACKSVARITIMIRRWICVSTDGESMAFVNAHKISGDS
jgi:hypothetical protein